VHRVTVEVKDSGSPVLLHTTEVTINVLDANEPPVFATTQNLQVPENSSPGTSVGTLVASDPDAGDTLTFSKVGGQGTA